MNQQSINAYSMPERVASYDGNMEVMHPNRSKMVQIALDVLPFSPQSYLKALDLGIGTGYFTKQFLQRYPHASVVAVDGAEAMIELARTRLDDLATQVDIRVADFRQLDQIGLQSGTFDVVFSSYALHHLNRDEKQFTIAQAMSLLKADGWFLNADLIVADCPQMEARIQELRIQGILERANRDDARFRDSATVRACLDEIERQDGDQPQSLLTDLQIMKDAGVHYPSIFWLEYREAVMGGQR